MTISSLVTYNVYVRIVYNETNRNRRRRRWYVSVFVFNVKWDTRAQTLVRPQ